MRKAILAGAAVALGMVGCAQNYKMAALSAQRLADQSEQIASYAVRNISQPGQLAAGTVIPVALQDTITSKKNQPGDLVAAVITQAVRETEGNVSFSSGTAAQVKVVSFQQPMPHQDDARILFELVSATVGNETYRLESTGVTSVKAGITSKRLMGSTAPIEFAVKGGTKVDLKLGQAVTVDVARS